MIEIKARGTQDFAALRKRLKDAPKEIRSELYRGINRATRPLKQAVRAAARTQLPRRGGLAKRVASSKIVTRRRTAGKGAGIRIVGRSGYDIGSINRGRVRHLTFGHLPWVDQTVKPGFWTVPLKAGAPGVRREIRLVMRTVAKKIEKG